MSAILTKRRADESELDYHKRIVYGKLVTKELADKDYSELSECIYGRAYASDVARRMFYGACKTFQLMDASKISAISDGDVISEIDAKTIELQKERKRLLDQRRELNKIVTSDARQERLYEVLAESAASLSETVGCMYEGHTYDTKLHIGSDAEAVLVLSDWHYGMKTDNIFNTYNTQVCKDRVCKVVSSTIDRLKLHKCRKLHVVILGDLCHGAIKVSTRVASEEYVCDQIMQVSEILAQSIECLSEYVDQTYVYMTYGNHARTVANKEESIHRDNMERLVPWWLSQRLAGHVNIIVQAEENTEFLFINACGHDFCASHGDNDTVRSSPRLLTTLFQKKYGKDIEYILLGDKHHRESFDELGVTAMLCGSLCGADDYANSKRLYSTPSQLLLIVNRECGVDAEYRINCN